jgi:hypothetical protein
MRERYVDVGGERVEAESLWALRGKQTARLEKAITTGKASSTMNLKEEVAAANELQAAEVHRVNICSWGKIVLLRRDRTSFA